ncbi:hypothetical protein BT63DRAFT_450782 [Microthyrium microscopicum]|uniref:Nuclear matrix protein n=1 Tax=Microthyrium microscopicum TaxID=703497 RepID=A0A6A6UM44_9PEZI|nr:hypothetical protein BT63DRAFT_450782 [Microthyrium microscopicum]
MAVMDSPSVGDATQRLKALIKQARNIKNSSNSIDPPLPTGEFSGSSGLPPNEISEKTHFGAVEIAAKRLFQEQIAKLNILNNEFGDVWNLFDILQILGDQGKHMPKPYLHPANNKATEQCEPVLLWYLIEELLDSQCLEGCRVVFDYLESRRERLVAKNFAKVSLVILRSCNELLRRLSRAEDSVFCGRVLIYVFQSFPLGDRSSVNRHGDYNIDNITAFDQLPSANLDESTKDVKMGDADADADADAAAESTKEVQEIPNPSKSKPMDFDQLYPVFWGLQKTLANPPRMFEPELLAEFKKNFEATLQKFNSVAKVAATPVVEHGRGVKRTADEAELEDFGNNFNPKYLTSRELFELELSDLSFQRHILVQVTILLDFLLSFTEKAKKKFPSRTHQKIQFTLSEEDTEWALQTKKDISASLREAADGPAFARVVETVLSRDKNWVRWKDSNCPDISRPPVTPETYLHAANGAKAVCSWKRLRSNPMGALDLTFLTDSKEARAEDTLSSPARYALPTAQTLVDRVANAELDLEMAMDEAETQRLKEEQASYTWRALRVVAATKLNLFEKLNSQPLVNLFKDGGVEHGPNDNNENDQETEGVGGSPVADMAENGAAQAEVPPEPSK